MYKAEWMVMTGKTSEDWDNLPLSDVKLIMVYLSAKRQAQKNDLLEVMGTLYGGKTRR